MISLRIELGSALQSVKLFDSWFFGGTLIPDPTLVHNSKHVGNKLLDFRTSGLHPLHHTTHETRLSQVFHRLGGLGELVMQHAINLCESRTVELVWQGATP